MTAALHIGPVAIESASRTVRVNGRVVPQLTRKEFAVLMSEYPAFARAVAA